MNNSNGIKGSSLRKITSLFLALLFTISAYALTFDVSYDASVVGSTNSAAIQSAFTAATQVFQSLYTNTMTVYLKVYYTATTNPGQSTYTVIGNPYYIAPTYAILTNALDAARITAADSNAVASLPASNPTATNVWLIPIAEAKALTNLPPPFNVDPDYPAGDGSIYFSSNSTYTFDPTNRAVAGKLDFIALAEREISKVLGRGYGLDYGIFTNGYLPYDLFRFTGNGVRSFNAGDTNVYFSIDDGQTALNFFYPDATTGDIQDWETGGSPDAYDANSTAGQEATLSSADLTALDILGYDLNFTPPSLAGVCLGNGTFQLTFTNVSGLNFSVLASTNLALSMTNWSVLGAPVEVSVGQYQFTDTIANQVRFYRVRLN